MTPSPNPGRSIAQLARRHGLVCYDPQIEDVIS